MNCKFGAYLIIPLKYSEESNAPEIISSAFEQYALKTMDINENVKNMFEGKEANSIGSAYKVPRHRLLKSLDCKGSYSHCLVSKNGEDYEFDMLDSYLFFFNTRIAFLCLGVTFPTMTALRTICNPGYAENSAEFALVDSKGERCEFSMELWLEEFCSGINLEKFYSGSSSMLLESFTYVLALTDTMFPSIESLHKATFNLHQMHSPDVPIEDESEADIRYVCAVKNSALNGYRWGCCVTSQTIAYAVADCEGNTDLQEEMDTQAADGLPIVMLALYEKYTCLRFTELIAISKTRRIKSILKLKKMMLNFQAFGTVTPANLSRWNNVKQIYAYLLEVFEAPTAVQDISTKIDILVAEQQEIESVRSSRIVNLITIFGVVGIMSSVQEIVQFLSDGSGLIWSVTLLTSGVLALCFGLAMMKK